MGGVQAGPASGHWGDQEDKRLSSTSNSSTAERSTAWVANVVVLYVTAPKHDTSSCPDASAMATASRHTPASSVTREAMEPTPPSKGWVGSILASTDGPAGL